MMRATQSALIVVDAQKAFVDSRGSLARTYGRDEILPNIHAWTRLKSVVARAGKAGIPVVLVRSEYRIGQFTRDRADEPLSYLCVPGFDVDCEWAEGLDVDFASAVVTKRTEDAYQSLACRNCFSALVSQGIRFLYFAGFQLTTCVKATAISTAKASSGVRSIVLKSASGARASSYLARPGGRSRVDRACLEMSAAGVEISTVLEVLKDAVVSAGRKPSITREDA